MDVDDATSETPAPGDLSQPRGPSDDALVQRVRAGALGAFELLMRRHNQRLFRAIRSVLRNSDVVEDAMQDTYLSAFRHLHQFEGRAQFGTWLLRIGINVALARRRQPVRELALDGLPEEVSSTMDQDGSVCTPEQQAARRELVSILEAAIDRLPDTYRQVFVLRMVDTLDSLDTAAVLGMTEAAVRQRLHRAREMIQSDLQRQAGTALQTAFGFLGHRCDSMVARVMRCLSTATLPGLGGDN